MQIFSWSCFSQEHIYMKIYDYSLYYTFFSLLLFPCIACQKHYNLAEAEIDWLL